MSKDIKIVDTELQVMEMIWKNDGAYAIDIAKEMTEINGWKKNTTYTLISRLIEKKAVERIEPKYFCKALVTKEEVVRSEANSLIKKICGGSKKLFLAAFLDDGELSKEEIMELKNMIEEKEM